MRLYKPKFPSYYKTHEDTDLVDLDDIGIYQQEDKNKHWTDIRLYCIKELGYAFMYMDYIHPGDWESQRLNVEALASELGENNNKIDRQTYWLGLKLRIEDEIEKMC